MKRAFVILITLSFITKNQAQKNIDNFLAAGINDAKQFTSDYIAPASEGLAYGINNGWFNHGKAPRRFSFEISVIANASFIKDDRKTFAMEVNDYENVRFKDNSASKNVATLLGQNDPDITVILTYDDPLFGKQEEELVLPTGISSGNISLIPTAFVQVGFSPFLGTQLKGRFFPNTKSEEAEIGLYGIGLQQEFTAWFPEDKFFPVSISGLIAYTHLNGKYDLTSDGLVKGENQKIETQVSTVLAQLIVSTKLKTLNVYGGLGYLEGESKTSLLGTYRVYNGLLSSEDIVDPFSIKQDVSGLRTTVGASIRLGFFGINADYTLAEINSASLGLNFMF